MKHQSNQALTWPISLTKQVLEIWIELATQNYKICKRTEVAIVPYKSTGISQMRSLGKTNDMILDARSIVNSCYGFGEKSAVSANLH